MSSLIRSPYFSSSYLFGFIINFSITTRAKSLWTFFSHDMLFAICVMMLTIHGIIFLKFR